MSNKELAKTLIDQIPDSKFMFIIPYLQGAAIPDYSPNQDTIDAFNEIRDGNGYKFSGSTIELFNELMEE